MTSYILQCHRFRCRCFYRIVFTNPFFFLAAEWWICEDDGILLTLGHIMNILIKGVGSYEIWNEDVVQNHIHITNQERQRLFLFAEECFGLKRSPRADIFCRVFVKILEALNQKTTRANKWVKNGVAELRVHDFYHQANNGARRINLTRPAALTSHSLQDFFIHLREKVRVFEMMFFNLVQNLNDLKQVVWRINLVVKFAEKLRNFVFFFRALECLEIREQFFVDEVYEFSLIFPILFRPR